VRALLTAAFLLTTLLFGAHQATAAPPTAADPPEILTPTEPPHPQPCKARPVPCDRTFSTLSANVPTTEPSEPTTTTTAPEEQAPPSGTATSDGTAEDRTATDDGTAAGPGRTTAPVNPPGPAGTNWWLIAIPVLALLALAAAGTVLLIQRSERRPH
jgi:hypothetical protein